MPLNQAKSFNSLETKNTHLIKNNHKNIDPH